MLKLFFCGIAIACLAGNGYSQYNNNAFDSFYAAFDTIDHNNTQTANTTSGQIEIHNDANATKSILLLGNNGTATSSATWGHNSIVSNSINDIFIYNNLGTLTITTMNENYWGYGSWPGLTKITLAAGSNATYLKNITYTPLNPINASLNPYGIPFAVSCGIGFDENAHHKGQQVLSIMTEDTTYRCLDLVQKGNSAVGAGEYKKGYDTLKAYIELCHDMNNSWVEFLDIDEAVQEMSSDSNRWVEYREWLKKVLYLNTKDSGYYCTDVRYILSSMKYFPGRGNDRNGSLAILKYVSESGKCPYTYWSKGYWDTVRAHEYVIYRDSVHDSTLTPFDTTLPNIHDLGLDILKGPQFGVSASDIKSPELSILSLVAKENPFKKEAEIIFEIGKPSLVRLEVYDALGRQMFAEGIGYYSAGKNSFKLNSSSWPSGTYFVRMNTIYDDVVKTIKLIHE